MTAQNQTARDLTDRSQRHPEKAHRPDNASPAKPGWIRVKAPNSPEFFATRNVIKEHGLATVCQGCGTPFTLATFVAPCPSCGGVHAVSPPRCGDPANIQFAGDEYRLPPS